jgi:hypothetical protein
MKISLIILTLFFSINAHANYCNLKAIEAAVALDRVNEGYGQSSFEVISKKVLKSKNEDTRTVEYIVQGAYDLPTYSIVINEESDEESYNCKVYSVTKLN